MAIYGSNRGAEPLDRSEEEMPGDIDGGVDQGGGENRAGLAPRPAVEKAGDGGQDHVTPVGKANVGDVRKAEENGSGPPAGKIAVGCSSKHVLQQAAEEKLFWPRREEQNAQRQKRERFPLRPLRRKLDEVHGLAQRNGDAAENDETRHDEETPTAAPADRIADAVDAAEKQERRKRDVYAEKHGENVGEPPPPHRPQPVRQGPSPGIRQRLHRDPYARENEEVLPGTRRLALGGGGQRQRNENEGGNSGSTCERESICPQAVNQIDKEHCGAEQVAAAGAEARGEAILHAARGKKQHHQKEKRESCERGSERAATIAQPGGVQRSGKSQHGPETEHRERAELARCGQARIVT